MTGTWKRELLYTYNGGHIGHGRKSRARNKPMDRRIKRREHARIIVDAIREYEADIEFNILDAIDYSSADDFNEWYNEHQFDYEDDYARHVEDYSDDYDDYYYEDYSYMDSYYSRPRDEDPHDRIIKNEDAGKSLGELLQEIIDRKERYDYGL